MVVSGVHLRQDVEVIIESWYGDLGLHGLMISVVGQVNVELVDVPEVREVVQRVVVQVLLQVLLAQKNRGVAQVT